MYLFVVLHLAQTTLLALRRYWATHRHSSLLFPGGKAPYLREGKPLSIQQAFNFLFF